MAAEGYGNNNRNRSTDRRPLWELYDTYEDPDRVAKFRRSDAPIYTGEPPNDDSRNWIHEVEAIMAASRYRQMSWVSLAVMQLRGEAATWWRSRRIDPWGTPWSVFTEMFLAQFPPPTYPRGSTSRVEDAMARFVTQYAIFDEIVDGWGLILNERMADCVERFERSVLQECPYRMSESRKCRLFWKAVPFSVKALTDYDPSDFCNLKKEVIIAEREYLRLTSPGIDSDEYHEEETPGVQLGEPIRTTEEDSEEDPEEDSEEDPEENPDEATN